MGSLAAALEDAAISPIVMNDREAMERSELGLILFIGFLSRRHAIGVFKLKLDRGLVVG